MLGESHDYSCTKMSYFYLLSAEEQASKEKKYPPFKTFRHTMFQIYQSSFAKNLIICRLSMMLNC